MGDAGVGGGGWGGRSSLASVVEVEVVLRGAVEEVVSVSVSEPDDSRSQLSATGLDFGLSSGFCGTVVLSLRCERVVAISVGIGSADVLDGVIWLFGDAPCNSKCRVHVGYVAYLFRWVFCGWNL